MKLIFAPAVVAVLFASCTHGTETTASDKNIGQKKTDTVKTIETTDANGCYQMVIGSDTAFMSVTQKQDSITGSLAYNRKEKDSNKGFVSLVKTNTRAEGWYTFQSEGKTSVRQIIFLATGNTFAEGFGEIKMNNDTAVFKYPHALNFEVKHPFNKVNCN